MQIRGEVVIHKDGGRNLLRHLRASNAHRETSVRGLESGTVVECPRGATCPPEMNVREPGAGEQRRVNLASQVV